MKQKPKRKRSIIVRVIVLLFAGYMLTTNIILGRQLMQDRAEKEKYEQIKATRELEIKELTDLLENGSHKDIIEKAARERLGYVYPNEEIYIDY